MQTGARATCEGGRAPHDRVDVREAFVHVARVAQIRLANLEPIEAIVGLDVLIKLHRHGAEAAILVLPPRGIELHFTVFRADLVTEPSISLIRVLCRAHKSTHGHLRVVAQELAEDHGAEL